MTDPLPYSNIPIEEIVKDPPSDLFIKNPDLWLKGLQIFISRQIAPKVIPDAFLSDRDKIAQIRNKLLQPKAMEIWKIAFTHSSFNPNHLGNYELLEHLGDRMMSAVFTDYMVARHPSLSEDEMNNLHTHYLSKVTQSEISTQMELPKWARTLIDRNIHLREDLLEAVFGALTKIGEDPDLFPVQISYDLCKNFIIDILSKITFDLRYTIMDIVTQVKNIFDKMKWGDMFTSGHYHKPTEDEPYYSLNLPQAALDFFRSDEGGNRILGPHVLIKMNRTGVDQKEFFYTALEKLKELGLTPERVDEIQEARDIANQNLVSLFGPALARANEAGYTRIEFPKPRKGRKVEFYQLVGVKEGGPLGFEMDVLITREFDVENQQINLIEVKRRILEDYVTKGPDDLF